MVKQLEFSTVRERNCFIINQRQKGIPALEIANDLKVSKRTVERVYSTYLNEGVIGRRTGSGRTPTLTPQLKQRIGALIQWNPQFTCQDLADRINNEVTAETIRLFLKDKEFNNKWPSKIPNLSRKDKTDRVVFAEENMEEEFDTTFFTDECMFTLNGHTKVWGKRGCRVHVQQSTYPSKVMVWGAISARGKAYLETVEGTMDRFKYAEMLEERFFPVANDIMEEEEWGFQHDGASCHRANIVKDLLTDYGIEPPEWPARSPDLNPIENIWSILKSQVYKRKPRTKRELEDFIFEEWENLDEDMVARVAESFNSRLEKVVERHGGVIDY